MTLPYTLHKTSESIDDFPPIRVEPDEALEWLKGCCGHSIIVDISAPSTDADEDPQPKSCALQIVVQEVFVIMNDIVTDEDGSCWQKIPAGGLSKSVSFQLFLKIMQFLFETNAYVDLQVNHSKRTLVSICNSMVCLSCMN